MLIALALTQCNSTTSPATAPNTSSIHEKVLLAMESIITDATIHEEMASAGKHRY